MRRARWWVVLVSVGVVVGLPASAWALPSQDATTPWPQTNGRVRALEIVDGILYVGGKFTSATDSAGDTRAVDNLAAFDVASGQWASISVPRLNSTGAEVWDLEPLGDGVVVAGKFKLSSSQKFLLWLRPSGVQWFGGVPQVLKSVLVAPNGRVYGGGTKIAAWDAATLGNLWNGRSTITTDPSLRAHNTPPAYRDLMWKDGMIYAACQCDALGATPVKALVRLDAEGQHDPSFSLVGSAGTAATGISVATDGTALYLGAGGSDFFAAYTTGGTQLWKRDTSGSVQSVEIHEGVAVVGGHFVEVADQTGDSCGFRSSDPGTLDPNDECQTRKYLAAYELDGGLNAWGPSLTGKYNGVWAIEPEGSTLHVGGEFTKVNGVARKFLVKFA